MADSGPGAQRLRPATVRSRMVMEIASALVGRREFPQKQGAVLLRPQGAKDWDIMLLGSDAPSAITEVASGGATLAIANPSAILTMACRGVPPFRGPVPVAAITVIPSPDQLIFAARPEIGVTTVEEIGQRKLGLIISVRAQRDHSVHYVVDHALMAAGFSLADVRAWGGEVRFDEGLPAEGERLSDAVAGRVDLIVDEAARTWVRPAAEAGMVLLSLREETLDRLVSWGYRRAMLAKGDKSGLPGDVHTLDFSGFPLFVSASAPDGLVRSICQALVERRDAIQLQDGTAIPLKEVCQGMAAAPLDIPWHPAAEQYWAEIGYL